MKKLEKIYYNPSHVAGYAGKRKLLSAVKLSGEKISDWLDGQDAYNKHKPVRRKFQRRSYSVDNVDDLWEIDLADMRANKGYNDNISYILIVIDVFSKMAWAEPVKDKTSNTVAQAFKKILARARPRIPECVQCDRGREFTGQPFQEFLKKQQIRLRFARSPDVKAAVAERFIRTIKDRIWRYFTHSRNRRYIDILQQLVESYNNARHSTTRMIPAAVNLDNAWKVRKVLREKIDSVKPRRAKKYRVGDFVRIGKARASFEKGYEGGYTEEVFKISRILSQRLPLAFVVSDLAGEEIDGIFYAEELSRVFCKAPKRALKIDKILRVEGRGNGKRALVCWKNLPDTFKTWVRYSELP